MKAFGIILIAIGILMLVFRGFNFTKKEKVLDLGPVEVNKKENKEIGWPVYTGAIAIVAGLVILLAGKKK